MHFTLIYSYNGALRMASDLSGFTAIAALLSYGVGLILGACKRYSDIMFEIIVSQEKGRER